MNEKLGNEDKETLQKKLTQVRQKIDQRRQSKDDLQAERDELVDKRSMLKNRLESRQSLEEKVETYEAKAEWAKEVYDELEGIISVYESVKSDLREQYLAYINEYTHEIFKSIYQNSSYQRVIITETQNERTGAYDYDIQLLRDDDMTEDPSNASGGERALVNLALRAGIYKLIAELEGGDRGRLPPFILDEPTTFLDKNHVGELEEMLNCIRDWDVPQVFVISHDDALIHGADHKCEVTKDASNTSQVTMQTAGDD